MLWVWGTAGEGAYRHKIAQVPGVTPDPPSQVPLLGTRSGLASASLNLPGLPAHIGFSQERMKHRLETWTRPSGCYLNAIRLPKANTQTWSFPALGAISQPP